ncbi:GTPase [Geodermatophilus sp. SYSU D00525]
MVTFAGAYSSGKTSLLKRLLFDFGIPVPADLAVGADPTTFEPRTERAGSLTLTDTPGLGSGQALHNQRTLDTCADTDVLVLVLTPQLLSAADDDAWALLTGDAWGGGALPAPAAWRAIVINKFDMAGADPLEDLDIYQQLTERKTTELHASLQSRDVQREDLAVFVTASDPFALVHDRQPEDGDYAIGEGWDGIPAVGSWLQQLPAALPLLRAQRAVRVRLRALATELQALSGAMSQVALERSTAEQNLHQCQSYTRELSRLRDQLRVERDEALESAVGRDMQAAATPDRDELVRDRLTKAIQRWIQAHADRLGSLAAQAPASLVLPEVPWPTPVHDVPDVQPGPAHVVALLKRLRDNRDMLRDTANAFEKLAADVPKLRPAQTWLKADVVTAAISAVDLLWKLGGHDEDEAAEASRRRQRYLKAATQAADAAAAPFVEWMDELTQGLQDLQARARAELEAAAAAEQGIHEARERLQRLIAGASTLA